MSNGYNAGDTPLQQLLVQPARNEETTAVVPPSFNMRFKRTGNTPYELSHDIYSNFVQHHNVGIPLVAGMNIRDTFN